MFLGTKNFGYGIDGYKERARQFSMPLQPELWGWGTIYKQQNLSQRWQKHHSNDPSSLAKMDI